MFVACSCHFQNSISEFYVPTYAQQRLAKMAESRRYATGSIHLPGRELTHVRLDCCSTSLRGARFRWMERFETPVVVRRAS